MFAYRQSQGLLNNEELRNTFLKTEAILKQKGLYMDDSDSLGQLTVIAVGFELHKTGRI